MRILGIDYGDARVGTAITDELGITAQGLKTIAHNGNDKILLAKLDEIMNEFNVSTIVGFVCSFPNVKELLCLIGLNVCFRVISDQIMGSKKEINNALKDLNGNALILKELIENLQEEERNLERDYEYKEVKSYENYLHSTEENTLEKPMVRKLRLNKPGKCENWF